MNEQLCVNQLAENSGQVSKNMTYLSFILQTEKRNLLSITLITVVKQFFSFIKTSNTLIWEGEKSCRKNFLWGSVWIFQCHCCFLNFMTQTRIHLNSRVFILAQMQTHLLTPVQYPLSCRFSSPARVGFRPFWQHWSIELLASLKGTHPLSG